MTYTNPGDAEDNIYKPVGTDPASGAHGVAEEISSVIGSDERTQGAVNILFGRMREVAWAATSAVALGQATITANGTRLRCTAAGNTGSTEPVWPTTVGKLVTDGTVTWQVLGASNGAYVPVGGVKPGPHFDAVENTAYSTPVLTSRLTDASGNPVAGQIVAKPAGEGSEAIIDWSHGDSTGYLFHLLDATGMTGPGLIGIGIQNGGTGLVMAKHGNGLLESVQTDASTTDLAMQWAHIGSGQLLKVVQGQTGTPGTLLTLQGWSGAPATSRVLSIQNTAGQEYAYFAATDLSFHLFNAAAGGHEVTWGMGSGVDQKMYVYTGSAGLWWANDIVAESNHLLIQSAAGAAAKGAESMHTMIDISNGNTMGFFGSAGTSKPAVTGSKGGNAALGSLMSALSALGLVTDSTSA